MRPCGRPALTALVGVSIVVLALAGGGYGPVALSAAAVLVWTLTIAVLLAAPRGVHRLASPAFAIAAGALSLLGLLTALSLAWSPDPGAGFDEVVRLGAYLGAFVLAGLLLGPGSGVAALRGLLLGVVGVALVALASRLLGLGAGDSVLAADLPAASGRLSYPLGYWNALGALMALGVPLVVAAAAVDRGGRRTGAVLACGVPVLLVIYMTSSRGALIAAAVGAGLAIGLSERRPRALAAAIVAVLAAAPAIVAAEVAPGILESAGDGTVGRSELAVLAATLACTALAFVVGGRAVERLERPLASMRLPRARLLVPALVLVAAAAVALIGPGRIVDDFSSAPSAPRSGEILVLSGSGRSQFWRVALEAFADEPERGIGAGGYATYWNQHSDLGTPTRNAHSEPLEILAEQGLLGFLLFAAFVAAVVAAAVARRRAGSAGSGAAIGVLGAGAVGLLIDWTWQIPAVVVPLLVMASGLAATGFATAAQAAAPRWRLGTVGASAATAGLVAIAAASVWAALALGAGARELERSDEALARGDAAAAAGYARSAAEIQPWAADPWLQLADIEQGVGNGVAARTAVDQAVRRSPDDFRIWIFATQIAARDGEEKVAAAYAQRAVRLGPNLFERIREFLPALR
jgi:O-antigen ligase